MQSRNENNIIARLEFICFLALELPIRIIDKNKDSRSPGIVSAIFHHLPPVSDIHIILQYEKFFPLIFHHILDEILEKEGDIWVTACT